MRSTYHRWSYALAAGLLLAGCKSNKDPEPVPEAKAPATAPAPKPAAPAPVPTLAPVTDATLSYLEELPGQKCRWVQHTPPGEPKTLFTLPTPCGLRWAWNPDGREALVTSRDGSWRVDLAAGSVVSQLLLPSGDLGTLGFDVQGRVVVLTEEPSEEDPSTGRAHAFRLKKDGTWARFETKRTEFLRPEAMGHRILHAFLELAPTSENGWERAYEALQDVPEDSPDFAALSAMPAPSGKGAWQQLETAAGPLYLWEARDGGSEWFQLTGPLLIRGDKGLVEPEGLSVSGSLSVAARGDMVLLASRDGSGKRVTRLWNAKTKKPVASLNLESEATFWPKPSSTPVRNLSPEGQLAVAFRTVYGASPEGPPKLSHEEQTYELRPAALEWIGDTAVLLTLAEIPAGCHGCTGAMGIHYLKPRGAGFAVKGSWPLLVEGAPLGVPTREWRIRRDLGRNPFLTSKGSDSGQGRLCEWVNLAELAPGGPILRGTVSLGYDNEGAIDEGDTVTRWKGRIAQPVPDRSFDVIYSGSESFTERYELQGEEYRPAGASRFEGHCR